jgi:hypothetical protein
MVILLRRDAEPSDKNGERRRQRIGFAKMQAKTRIGGDCFAQK